MTAEDIPAFLDRRSLAGAGRVSDLDRSSDTRPPGGRLIYTFSNLNAYLNCPHAMYRRYIKRDIPYVETPAIKHGNEVHTAFELRVGHGQPLPQSMSKWESFATPFTAYSVKTEQKLAIAADGSPLDYGSKSCWFRGKIDAYLIQGDKGYIVDWKTGNSKYENPFELEVGALLLKAHNRQLTKVIGQYAWLKDDRMGVKYDLSDFKKTWGKIKAIVAQIERDEFKKKRSGLCGWCDVKDCAFNTKKGP